MSDVFNNVSVNKTANVYFDGKCVSHTITLADGTRKSVGVILPSTLTFNVGVPEIMELLAGKGRVQVSGGEWQNFEEVFTFNVPENSSFIIEVSDTVHYVCHFG